MMTITKQFSDTHYGHDCVIKRMIYLTEVYVGLYILTTIEEYKSTWVYQDEAIINTVTEEFRDRKSAYEKFDKLKERLMKIGDTESSHS